MSNFIAEVTGRKSSEDGEIVVVRVTGLGPRDGAMMTRAKARAIVASRFGKSNVKAERTKNVETDRFPMNKTEEITASKDESLYEGEISGVKDRIEAFRRNGLFAVVQDSTKLDTDYIISEDSILNEFGKGFVSIVNTYEYDILVTTRYAFG